MHDFELGVERRSRRWFWSSNLYYMRYRDQLVLVGNINDVGAYTRINVPNSYRLGLELQGKLELHRKVHLSGNLTLSRNRILDYTERIDDFDNGGTKDDFYKSTDIAFSPAVVGGGTLEIIPFKQASVSFTGKYVSRQYMDNTSQRSRSLNPFYVQDIRLSYQLSKRFFKSTDFILQLNNVFSKRYEANGYTFSYIAGGQQVTENFYFPMAPFNWMLGLNIRI
jgi:iron complex outermembrane receptor protein